MLGDQADALDEPARFQGGQSRVYQGRAGQTKGEGSMKSVGKGPIKSIRLKVEKGEPLEFVMLHQTPMESLIEELERPAAKSAKELRPKPVGDTMSVPELAQYSGLSVRNLRTLIAATVDAIPHHRIGRRVLVKRSDFDQWQAQHRKVGQDIEERIEKMQRGRKGTKPPRPRAR
jgi:excisionase family DNA binding protein